MNDDPFALPHRLQWCMDALDVCSQEVDARGLWSDRALPLAVLEPPPSFEGLHLQVYRCHAAELCDRFLRRRKLADLDCFTTAEVLVGLVAASAVAPLSSRGFALYVATFREVFGADAVPELHAPPRESWDGQIADALAAAKRQRVARRRAPL